VGLEGAVQGVEGWGSGEPVECLKGRWSVFDLGLEGGILVVRGHVSFMGSVAMFLANCINLW
jgi:hypothetical protein